MMPELTAREQHLLAEAGIAPLHIAYLAAFRWSLWRYGRGHNPLVTPETLRNRCLAPAPITQKDAS